MSVSGSTHSLLDFVHMPLYQSYSEMQPSGLKLLIVAQCHSMLTGQATWREQ